MKSAAIEYAKQNIQINCLAPGFIESSFADNFKKEKKELFKWTISQTPMGRWGNCDEIADLALFLVSEKKIEHHQILVLILATHMVITLLIT